jgi:hypothetical protein
MAYQPSSLLSLLLRLFQPNPATSYDVTLLLDSFIIFSFTRTPQCRYFAFEKDDLSPGLINFGDTSVKVKCT